jgi:Flp pilus assembly protein TadD
VYVVALVALAVRLLYLTDLRHTPFFADPQMDALYHDQWARRLAGGDWVGSGVFFRAPLYPYFLGILYRLLGPDYLAVRLIQAGIGAGTAFLTAVLPYRRLGRGAAIGAGFLVALHAPLIYFEGELLLVVLEAPLFLLAAWGLDRAVGEGGGRRWAAAGFLLGFAALVRPTILAVYPVAAVVLLVRRGWGAWRGPVVLGAVLLLTLLPVLARNYVVGRDLVPVASQGGLNYYLGNNAAADGRAAVAPEFRRTWTGGLEDATRQAELARGRSLRPSEVSAYWMEQALRWAREDPGAFLQLQMEKLGYFWDAFEIPNNQDPAFFAQLTRIFRGPWLLSFGVLGPLALAGLVLGVATRRIPWVWIATPLTLMVVVVAFFVTARFRASLAPLFAIWAGAGLAAVGNLSRPWRTGAPYGLLLLCLGWAMNADLAGQRQEYRRGESFLRLGIHSAAGGDLEEARYFDRLAVAENPRFADGWNNLGTILAQGGDLAGARRSFRTALRLEPRHPKAMGNLAALAWQTGRVTEADSLARSTLRVAGREPEALYNAAVVLGNLGDVAAARDAFHAIVEQQPWNAAARVGEARALLAGGEVEKARAVLEAAAPPHRSAELNALLEAIGTP